MQLRVPLPPLCVATIVAAALSGLTPQRIEAQAKIVELTAPEGTSSCAITLERLAEIGGTDEASTLTPFSSVTWAPDLKEYLVAPTYENGRVAAFSEAGAFLKTFGKRGKGPGEFSNIRALRAMRGDSVVVLDATSLIQTTTADHFVRRAATTPRVFGFLALPDGRLILNNNDGRQAPLVLLEGADARYRPVRTFGTAEPDDRVMGRVAALANGANGTFWWAFPNRLEISQWDTGGRALRVFRLSAAWFTPWDVTAFLRSQTSAGKPQSRVVWLEEDGGILWVIAMVADRKWKAPAVKNRESVVPSMTERHRSFDAIVLAIDPTTERLLAVQRFDVPIGLIGDGRVSSLHEIETGEVVARIARLTIHRGGTCP